jgi:hypothetical protein
MSTLRENIRGGVIIPLALIPILNLKTKGKGSFCIPFACLIVTKIFNSKNIKTMIFENLEQNFIDCEIGNLPENQQAILIAAFRKGAAKMAELIIDYVNGGDMPKTFRFIGWLDVELEIMKGKPPIEFVLYPNHEAKVNSNQKVVFVNDPMWFEPHNGKVGEKYVGLNTYNAYVNGTLKVKHLGGDTDYYYIIDDDGREWGVEKIATPEGFNKASNADELWFLPSLAYLGCEVVGLTHSGQYVYGAKLCQENGVWYVKGENECIGLEVIRIADPEVYKKMQEIKDAKDLRDEK